MKQLWVWMLNLLFLNDGENFDQQWDWSALSCISISVFTSHCHLPYFTKLLSIEKEPEMTTKDLPVFGWWLPGHYLSHPGLYSFLEWHISVQHSTAVWFHLLCAIFPSAYTLSNTACSLYKRHAMTFKSSTPAWSYTIPGFSLAC